MKKKHQVALALSIIIIVAAAIVYEAISAKPSTWQVDARLSGSGTKDTTEFTMDTRWRIEWAIIRQNDPLFILSVYMKNDTGGYSWVADPAKHTQTPHRESCPCSTQAPSSCG